MSSFVMEREQDFGSVTAKLYTYRETGSELSRYIQDKIQQSSVIFSNILDEYGDGLDKNALLERHLKLTTPANHSIPTFDVKRSTVTEFMAEFMLEKEFQCIFFEQTNKKINKPAYQVNRHSQGIDVVGVQGSDEESKFIVAEVKASAEDKVPCAAGSQLKDDVKRIIEDNARLCREIITMIPVPNNTGQDFSSYISFLLRLLDSRDSASDIVNRIIIFPFLIRNNQEVLEQNKLDDFQNFSELDTMGYEICGIVWALNKDIQQFVESIYAAG